MPGVRRGRGAAAGGRAPSTHVSLSLSVWGRRCLDIRRSLRVFPVLAFASHDFPPTLLRVAAGGRLLLHGSDGQRLGCLLSGQNFDITMDLKAPVFVLDKTVLLRKFRDGSAKGKPQSATVLHKHTRLVDNMSSFCKRTGLNVIVLVYPALVAECISLRQIVVDLAQKTDGVFEAMVTTWRLALRPRYDLRTPPALEQPR